MHFVSLVVKGKFSKTLKIPAILLKWECVNVYSFLVDYNSVDKSDMLNIHKYLMTKNNIKYSSVCLLYYWALVAL